MKQLTQIFNQITSVEVTKTNKYCYTFWLINAGKLEVVLMHGQQFNEVVINDNHSLRDFYIVKQKSYWFVTRVVNTYKIFPNSLQTTHLELSPGMKIHLKDKGGTYEVLKINSNKTVLITCNTWLYDPKKPTVKLINESEIHCLTGGLVNFRFLK